MAASTNNNPWAWLGLLKWSLSYADGTSPTTANELSVEDREFLEAVMKEGIIDENERMKTILNQMTEKFEKWSIGEVESEDKDQVDEILEELRDIVEQIDYARAFAAMKGLVFILGCVQEATIPLSTKIGCLGVMATLCQHNPPVQKEFLELGAIRILSELFFRSVDMNSEEGSSVKKQYQAKLVQAISANVRSFDLAESVFTQLEQAPALMNLGLESDALAVRKRTLFFLRAILTSDTADENRVARFLNSVLYCIDSLVLDSKCEAEIVEIALSLIAQLLEKRRGCEVILSRKTALVGRGVHRVSELRSLTGEDAEVHSTELELWENFISLVSSSSSDTTVLGQ